MTVAQLKEAIADLPDEMEVILQKDSGGNGYSPLAGANPESVYVPDSTYSGAVYDPKWAADVCMSLANWQNVLKEPHALILYPVN